MTEVGAYEAKTHLSQLLDRVAGGERITITRHGGPVADLVPTSARTKESVSETIAALLEFRRGQRLEGDSLRDMIEEGRQ
jgi:prevent-host-death family protein